MKYPGKPGNWQQNWSALKIIGMQDEVQVRIKLPTKHRISGYQAELFKEHLPSCFDMARLFRTNIRATFRRSFLKPEGVW